MYIQISTCVFVFMLRWDKQSGACAVMVLRFLRSYILHSYWTYMNLANKGKATARSEASGAVSAGELLQSSSSHWHTSMT